MNTIQFRVIRYIVDKEVYYLGTTFVERAINVVDIGTTFVERAINVVDIGTTLRDSLFTIDVLKDLYWMRWNIETFFKTIKYRLRRI